MLVVADDLEDGMAAYDAGDHQKAFRLWKRSAEQGAMAAQILLGSMYAEGKGVPEDDVRAYVWLSIVATQRIANAQKAKEAFAELMTPAQIADGQKSSSELWEKYVVPFQKK
jgi:TPR repeat protein